MKFKVGDKVRVRSWESMEKEFGLNWRGDINCPVLFLKGMKEYCGTIQTITAISQRHSAYYIGNTNYYFDRRALEPIKQETKGEHNRKEIKQIRQQYKEIGLCNSVAVNKNDKPCSCIKLHCSDCLLSGSKVTCGERFKMWCAEPYKEPKNEKSFLDEEEKAYLAAVLAPKQIREGILGIMKNEKDSSYYRILIWYKDPTKDFQLKPFKKSSKMYEGLEEEKVYSLSTLGI